MNLSFSPQPEVQRVVFGAYGSGLCLFEFFFYFWHMEKGMKDSSPGQPVLPCCSILRSWCRSRLPAFSVVFAFSRWGQRLWWKVGCHHSACSAPTCKATLTACSLDLGAAIGPSCPWMSSAKPFLSLRQRALYSVWENKIVQPFSPRIPAVMLSRDFLKWWLHLQWCEHGAG